MKEWIYSELSINGWRRGSSACFSFGIMSYLNKIVSWYIVRLSFFSWDIRLREMSLIYFPVLFDKLIAWFVFHMRENILLFFGPWLLFFFYGELWCIIEWPFWFFSLMFGSALAKLTIGWVSNSTIAGGKILVDRWVTCSTLGLLKERNVFKGWGGVVRWFWAVIYESWDSSFGSLRIPPRLST